MRPMNKIAKLYFGKTPAVVCTAGSYIALINEAAKAETRELFEERYLFDSMDPWDVLKYESAFLSQKDRLTMTFPLRGFFGYRYATAVFERLMGRRFAVVYLSEECNFSLGEELSCKEETVGGDVRAFLERLTSLSDRVFDYGDRLGLMDLRESVFKVVSRIEKDIDCRIRVTESAFSRDLDVIPVSVPLNSFMQMTMLLLSALSLVSVERRIEIKIVSCNGESELKIFTDQGKLKKKISDVDALIEEIPALSVLLSTCSFVAGSAGCRLSVRTDSAEDRLCASLILCDTETEKVDFKCRDPYKYFEKELSFVKKYVEALL